jgi:DHA3 family macrolide efflux protein-like MFS transporter
MYELTESPLQVTFANVLWALPWSIIGGFAGTIASKYNDKNTMIFGRLLSFSAMLSLSILSFLGYLNVFFVYITLFIHGSGVVIDFPAKRQLMLDILGRDYIVRGNAIEAFFWQFSKLIGPLLAATFLSFLNESFGLLLICVFLFINLVSII